MPQNYPQHKTIYFFIFSKQKYFQAIILWPQDFRARSELILVLFSKYQPFRVLMRAWFVVLQSQRQQNSMIWALLVEFPFNQKTTILLLLYLWLDYGKDQDHAILQKIDFQIALVTLSNHCRLNPELPGCQSKVRDWSQAN